MIYMSSAKEVMDSKALVGVLGFLCVVIVGLVVGIVVVNLNQGDSGGGNGVSYDCSVEENVDSEQALSEEEIAASDEFAADFNLLEEEADKLFGVEPVDLDAVVSLYEFKIQKYIERGDYRRAALLINTRTAQLVSRGYDQVALDALTPIDFSKYSEVEQYRQYQQIIDIAEKLGKNDVIEKYDTLRAGVKEAFEASEAKRIAIMEEQEAKNEYCKGRSE